MFTFPISDLIHVARYDGSSAHALPIHNLDRPRAFVISPYDKLLFWTDWGSDAMVARANMDGTDQKPLVSNGLGWPNGLGMLFFCVCGVLIN